MFEILFDLLIFAIGVSVGAGSILIYAIMNEPEPVIEPNPGFVIHQKLIDSSDIHDGEIGKHEDREDSIDWERDEDYVELAVEYLIRYGLNGCSDYPHRTGAWWSATSTLYGEYGMEWDMEELSAHPVGFTPTEEELIFHRMERYWEKPRNTKWTS